MFSGLSAFPLTPLCEGKVDEKAFVRLMQRLVQANVDSIGVLGSTGNYAYLSRAQRYRITQLSVEHAESIPVFVSIGDPCLAHVLDLLDDAQKLGVQAVMLAPVSYQPLFPDEVYHLFEQVTRHLSVPLVVYDNPRTTSFTFTPELLQSIAQLPQVASIKLSAMGLDVMAAQKRLKSLRQGMPTHLSLGVSGDAFAVTGLQAGCEVWYSVLAGWFPGLAQALMQAVRTQDTQQLAVLNNKLQLLWDYFARFGGGLRCIATLAVLQGQVSSTVLPAPLQLLGEPQQTVLRQWLESMQDWVD